MGFIRTYASMIAMMVLNVLFLKLILVRPGDHALRYLRPAVVPAGGRHRRVARKADNLISKIGRIRPLPAIRWDTAEA